MLTTSCPKCEKEVTVPAAARAQSRVRCPLCSEEYTLESVFADMPPLLELLDAPSTNGPAGAADTADAAAESAEAEAKTAEGEAETGEASAGMFDFDKMEREASGDEGDIAVAEAPETVDKSSAFDFGDSAPAATSAAGAATAARKPRARKKTASPMKSIIGVIIGGICALPIAQLTLWYLPGGWDVEQRDPVGLGRSLSGTFASFIVPSWVTDADGDDTAHAGDSQTQPGSANDNGQDDAPAADYEEPDGLGSLLGSAHDNNGGNRRNGRNKNGNGNPENNGDDEPPADEANDNRNNNGNSGSNGDDDQPPPAGVKNAPTYATSKLSEALKSAKAETERFDDVTNEELDGSQRIAIRDDFFAAIGRLAEVTTFAEEKPDGHREHLDEILADAGDTAKKRRIIGVSALGVMKEGDRSSDGIILVGDVREIHQRGQLFETVLEVEAPEKPPVSVYGLNDPSAMGAFKEGDTVMILGVIVDAPLDELRGYKGPPDPVVWGGYSKVIPTAE